MHVSAEINPNLILFIPYVDIMFFFPVSGRTQLLVALWTSLDPPPPPPESLVQCFYPVGKQVVVQPPQCSGELCLSTRRVYQSSACFCAVGGWE